MPKFRVYTIERIERGADYTIELTRDEVVSALHLSGAAADDWRNHVEDYLYTRWDKIRDLPSTIENGYDDNSIDTDIESVEPEEEPATHE